MRKSKMRFAALFTALALVLAMGLSLAYFTDREEASTTATAGTLDLVLTQDWVKDNPNSDDTKPGDIYTLNYTLTNAGNKSADVREVFVITSDVPLASTAPAEFEIYAAADVEVVNGFNVPKTGVQPLSVRSSGSYTGSDGNTYYTVTYNIPEFILNGTGNGAETEPNITSNAKTASYVVLFTTNASNDFQGANITIDYLAEAKQHRNTDDSIWSTVASETITFAGEEIAAVPEA